MKPECVFVGSFQKLTGTVRGAEAGSGLKTVAGQMPQATQDQLAPLAARRSHMA